MAIPAIIIIIIIIIIKLHRLTDKLTLNANK